jgi:LysR family transcriptional regulator, hydrogen peroxide-inducible genes activator
MEIRQVEYFRALCDELNFTRAAKRSGISQPSLTRSIRLLEEEFGGQLFHREGAKTRLSELGQIVKPHLDAIFEQTHAATNVARNFAERRTINLKLGVMCTVAPTDLVGLLAGVRMRHPDIDLEISDANAAMLNQKLTDGELEVAIIGHPENETLASDLHFLPLYREQFMIVVAPEHKLSSLDRVRCLDLHGEAYLRRVNCELADFSGRVFREQGVKTLTVYRSDRDDWILAMAAAGMGFSFMPSRSVNHPQVTATPLTEPEFWRDIGLVTVRGRPHSRAVGALVHEATRAASTMRRHDPKAELNQG